MASPGPSSLKRKRASVACTNCHTRKVRCNVSELGPPCTNCRLDGERCDVRRSRRTAGPSKPTVDSDRLVWHSEINAFMPAEVVYSAYEFLHLKDVHKLPQEDVQYLNIKGCFCLPTRPVLAEFVSQYFTCLHPSLPVLNEKQFWQIFHAEEDSEDSEDECLETTIPLFVMHAMLYATCGFMPTTVIKRAGYGDVRETRDIFYRRAKLLYDLNTESSHFWKSAGALLLTYRFSPDDKQAGSVWLNISIQHAQAIHAHRFHKMPLDGESRVRLKRLWWCIFLRDRIIALGLRRPMQITPANSSEPEEVLVEADFADEIHESMVHEAETKKKVCQIMTGLCRLALIITDVLETIGQTRGPKSTHPAAYGVLENLEKAKEIKDRLREWRRNNYEAINAGAREDEFNFPVVVFSNMALMYYHASCIALGNFEVATLARGSILLGASRVEKLQQVSGELDTAVRATETLIVQFITYGIIDHLSITALVYMSFPLLLRMLNYCLGAGNAREDSQRYTLAHCTEIIKRTLARYEGAGDIPYLIMDALASVGISTSLRVFKDNILAPFAKASERRSPQLSDKRSILSGSLYSWQDLIVASPYDYLRLSGCLDEALASGERPDESRLLLITDGSHAELPGIELPMEKRLPEAEVEEAETITESSPEKSPAEAKGKSPEVIPTERVQVIPTASSSSSAQEEPKTTGKGKAAEVETAEDEEWTRWSREDEAQVGELFETLASLCYA